MKEFFTTFFAVIAAFIVMTSLMLVIFFGIIASWASMQNKKPTIQHNSILTMDFTSPIIDNPSSMEYKIDLLSGAFSMDNKQSLRSVIRAIRNAAADTNIRGISLELTEIPTDLSLLEEIRFELEKFKESGKFIYAYSNEGYSQKAYYMASVADKVYLNPVGGFTFQGLYYSIPFFKDFFDKFNIEMQVIRHGKYKSAVEPYLSNKMSEANREQISSFVNVTWNNILTPISKSRGISIEDLNRYADELAVTTPEQAKTLHFIDEIVYADEYIDLLKTKILLDSNEKLSTVSLSKYILSLTDNKTHASDKIAIIYAQGDIINGKSVQGSMGNETICKALEDARKDKNVKAVVFRVNSPGGSASASDFILREVSLTVKEKPVIVSMGSYAASGGYYISCGADYIFSDPTTLTGSIGVFAVIPCVQKLLKEDLNINFEGVKTNKNADYLSSAIFEPITPYQKTILQGEIERIYDDFITHVADGREMTKAEVDSIGQGRVWTGSEAIEIGLVDELGGLTDAIVYAAEKSGLSTYEIKEYPKKTDFFEEIMQSFYDETISKSLKDSKIGPVIKAMEDASNMEGIQARLPFVLIEGN